MSSPHKPRGYLSSCLYIYIHKYEYTYVYICICTYVCVCVYTYIHICMHALHTCTHICMLLYTHTRLHPCAYREQGREREKKKEKLCAYVYIRADRTWRAAPNYLKLLWTHVETAKIFWSNGFPASRLYHARIQKATLARGNRAFTSFGPVETRGKYKFHII